MCAIPGRAISWAPCSPPELRPPPTSRPGREPDKIRTSPALSADGSTLYVGLGFDFCAVDTATMATNWCHRLHADVSDSSPAVGIDGTIYIGDRDNTFSAFNPEWHDQVPDQPRVRGRHLEPSRDRLRRPSPSRISGAPSTMPTARPRRARASSGRSTRTGRRSGSTRSATFRQAILAGHRRRRHDLPRRRCQAISTPSATRGRRISRARPGGPRRIWKYRVSSQSPGLTASPVISADSTTLYIGTNSAIPGIPLGLTALDITNPACFSSTPPPCNPIRWTFATAGKVDQTPALAADGTLYVPAMDGGQKRLYAVNPNGTLKWVFGPIASSSETSAYPIIGADGVVYVGIKNGIYALSAATGDAALGLSDDQLHPGDAGDRWPAPGRHGDGHHLRALSRQQDLQDLRGVEAESARTARPLPTRGRINRPRSARSSPSTDRAATIRTAIPSSSTSGSSATARRQGRESHAHVPEPEPAGRLCRDAGREGRPGTRAPPIPSGSR